MTLTNAITTTKTFNHQKVFTKKSSDLTFQSFRRGKKLGIDKLDFPGKIINMPLNRFTFALMS